MILLFMIFFHIVDDYYLQGILAKMKQREWWEENAPDYLYKYDWIIALIMHSFSWVFMVMLPIAYKLGFALSPLFGIMFGVNLIIHGITDHLKANELNINLIEDQLIHIGQILATFILSKIFLF